MWKLRSLEIIARVVVFRFVRLGICRISRNEDSRPLSHRITEGILWKKSQRFPFKQKSFLRKKGQEILFMFVNGGLHKQEITSVSFNKPPLQQRKRHKIEFLGEIMKRSFLSLLVARSSCDFKFSFFSKSISFFCSARRLSFNSTAVIVAKELAQ